MRISNLFSIAIVAVCAAVLAFGQPADWWQHLVSFAIVLAAGMLLFSIGWMGGGDAKLMAAAGLAFNLTGLLRFLPLVLLTGGLIALIAIFWGRARARRAGEARGGVPYGVAIAIGAIAGLFLFRAYTAFAI
jgi:prepilin peptidase CpaA